MRRVLNDRGSGLSAFELRSSEVKRLSKNVLCMFVNRFSIEYGVAKGVNLGGMGYFKLLDSRLGRGGRQ